MSLLRRNKTRQSNLPQKSFKKTTEIHRSFFSTVPARFAFIFFWGDASIARQSSWWWLHPSKLTNVPCFRGHVSFQGSKPYLEAVFHGHLELTITRVINHGSNGKTKGRAGAKNQTPWPFYPLPLTRTKQISRPKNLLRCFDDMKCWGRFKIKPQGHVYITLKKQSFIFLEPQIWK